MDTITQRRRRRLRSTLGDRVDSEPGAIHDFQRPRDRTERGAARSVTVPLDPRAHRRR
jgi:hypothetical protein